MVEPVYFLTFRTYGTWLHGDERGSVDRDHGAFGEPALLRDDGLRRRRAARMNHAPFLFDTPTKRRAVREAIARTCELRAWNLLALNVRTNHVHVVLGADKSIEKTLSTLKAWSTRMLRERGLLPSDVPAWSHHGSTRYLTSEESVLAAVNYTSFEQGPDLE